MSLPSKKLKTENRESSSVTVEIDDETFISGACSFAASRFSPGTSRVWPTVTTTLSSWVDHVDFRPPQTCLKNETGYGALQILTLAAD